jgi:hypothetical protein
MLIVFTVVRLAERKRVGVWGDCGRDCVGRLWEGVCGILQRVRLFTVDKALRKFPQIPPVKVWWRSDRAL